MPGVLGIIQSGMNSEPGSADLQSMIHALMHFPWYRSARRHFPGAALGLVSLGTLTRQPSLCTSTDGRFILAFEGEIYNAAKIHEDLGLNCPKPSQRHDHSALVLQAWLRWKTRTLERLNGLFQLAVWDTVKEELTVANDPTGMRALYFIHKGNAVAFAPEVKALLDLPWTTRDFDSQGLATFLRHGCALGRHTFFKDIQLLPPGTVATFCRGRLKMQRYWRMSYHEDAALSLEKATERLVEVWLDVIRRQSLDELRYGSLLSGGLDSRFILAGLVAQQRKVNTFTLGHPGTDDVRIAQRTADAAHCPNLFSPVVAREVALGLEKAMYLCDGMFNCFHANIRHLLPSLVESANLAFDGISILDSYYHFYQPTLAALGFRAGKSALLRHAFHGQNPEAYCTDSDTLIKLMSADLSASIRAEGYDFLDDFYQRNEDHVDSPFAMVDLFYLEQRMRRFTANGAHLVRSVVDVRCPFLDKRLLELVGTLPAAYRSQDKVLIKAALCRISPELARIPWERNGLPQNASLLRTYLYAGAKALRRKAGNWLEQTGRGSWLSERLVIDYDRMLRATPELLELVTSHLINHSNQRSGLFNAEGVQALLNHHLSGRGNHADMIGRILTIEMWHRRFAAGELEKAFEASTRPEVRVREAA